MRSYSGIETLRTASLAVVARQLRPAGRVGPRPRLQIGLGGFASSTPSVAIGLAKSAERAQA